MTSALAVPGSALVPAANSGWTTRAGEFLAVGGASLFLFPLAALLRTQLGLESAELAVGFVMFHAAHVINDPHFSVTYLLFYRNFRDRAFGAESTRAQRLRYLIAGVLVPIALAAWATTALHARSAQTLGWMIQLMFLLVGWHYAKQGFGVLTVLSARRGVRFNARERWVILAHCFAAWAFAWANPTRAAGEFEEKGVVYWSPAHPRWLEVSTGAVFALSSIALLCVLTAKARREGKLPLVPLSGFLITIWLWTIYTGLDPLVRYTIPALHSIQYLYFVGLMKRNQARAFEGPPWFGPPPATRLTALAISAVLLGWLLLRGAPGALDVGISAHWARDAAAKNLGDTPFFAAFFVFVNIHHYFMDAVIWRRDNPETAYLLEPQSITT